MEKSKIIFLGSGGGRKVTASQARATGGFVVKVGTEQIHADPGPGAIVNAVQFGIDVADTTMILVSHFHVDHSNDVNAIINTMTFSGKDKKGVLFANEICDKSNLTKCHMDAVEKYVKLKHCEKKTVRNIIIQSTKT